MITLKNDKLRLQLDDRGRLVWLEDLTSENGNRIANPKPIFRAAILRTQDAAQMGENKEDTAFAEEQDVSVALEGETAVVTVKNLKTHMGEKAAEIRLTVTLDGDHVRFSGTIRNDSDTCIDELI